MNESTIGDDLGQCCNPQEESIDCSEQIPIVLVVDGEYSAIAHISLIILLAGGSLPRSPYYFVPTYQRHALTIVNTHIIL